LKSKLLKVIVAGYLFPGLAHIYLGRFKKGIFFMLSLTTLFTMGLFYNGEVFSTKMWIEHSEHFFGPYLVLLANFCNGILFIICVISGLGQGNIVSPDNEIGNTYIMVAGLLNILVIYNAIDILKDKERV